MTKTQKNKEILANKGKALGRGKKFPVKITEQARLRFCVWLLVVCHSLLIVQFDMKNFEALSLFGMSGTCERFSGLAKGKELCECQGVY